MINSYTKIYNGLLEDENLKTNEKMVLIVIISYYNEKYGFAYPSYKDIKKRSSIKKDETIINAIKALIDKKYLEKTTLFGKGARYYLSNSKREDLRNGSTSEKVGAPTPKWEEHPLRNGSTINTKKTTKTNNIYLCLKFIDEIIENVRITREQYDTLKEKYGEKLVNKKILDLDNYIANGKGKSYKDHNRVLHTWIKNEPLKPKVELLRNEYVKEELV